MPQNKKVSILIPVYNREKSIITAVECAVKQTYPDIEIVCVDNASTDNTWAVLQELKHKYPSIIISRNEENLGPVKNWFRALELSSGDYIKFLWSDDEMSTDCIVKLMIGFEKNIAFSYSITTVHNVDKNTNQDYYHLGETGFYPSELFIKATFSDDYSTPVSPGCALFSRKAVIANLKLTFENNMNLNFPRYGAGNDLYLFLQSTNDYPEIYFVNKPLSIFNNGNDSLSGVNKLDAYYAFVRSMFLNDNKEKYQQEYNKYLTMLRFSDNKEYQHIAKQYRFRIDGKVMYMALKERIKNILSRVK